MRISRPLLLAMALLGWCQPRLAAQGLVSIAIFPAEDHPVAASFSGEMLLVTDTLRFHVESAVVQNELDRDVVVESAILGLGQWLPDGSWEVAHRGYAFPVGLSADAGSTIELNELALGLTRPGLLAFTDLQPMVELVLSGPVGIEPSRAILNETLGALFKLAEGQAAGGYFVRGPHRWRDGLRSVLVRIEGE